MKSIPSIVNAAYPSSVFTLPYIGGMSCVWQLKYNIQNTPIVIKDNCDQSSNTDYSSLADLNTSETLFTTPLFRSKPSNLAPLNKVLKGVLQFFQLEPFSFFPDLMRAHWMCFALAVLLLALALALALISFRYLRVAGLIWAGAFTLVASESTLVTKRAENKRKCFYYY